MTLIRLEGGDLIRCIRTHSISVIKMWIYRWLEDQSLRAVTFWSPILVGSELIIRMRELIIDLLDLW